MRLGGAAYLIPIYTVGSRTGNTPSWFNRHTRRMIQILKPWHVMACWYAGKMTRRKARKKFGCVLWKAIHAHAWRSNIYVGLAQRRINRKNVCWSCFGIMRRGMRAKMSWIGFINIISKSNDPVKVFVYWYAFYRKRVLGWIQLNPCGFMPSEKLLSQTENYPPMKSFPEFALCSLPLSCLSWWNPKMFPVSALG